MSGAPRVSVTTIRKGPVVIKQKNTVSRGAFIGTAKKGPLRVPTLVKSYADFAAIFGQDEGNLDTSVRLFFKNGGGECYISRAAHYTTISDSTTYDAVAASKQLQDAAPANTIVVNFSSPCAEGNNWKVTTTRKSVVVTTLATQLTAVPQTSAVLTNANRISKGDLITISDGVDSITVTVTSKNGNTVYFASVTPGGVIATAGSSVTLLLFDMQALDGNDTVQRTWSDLRMSSLSARYFLDVVNNDYRTPFTLEDDGSTTADPRPANTSAAALASGSDGTTPVAADYVGSSVGKTGVYAFDTTSDFGMLSIPDSTSTTVVQELLDYAAAKERFVAVCDFPEGTSPSGALTFVNTTINRFTRFGEITFSWLKVVSPTNGATVLYPNCGARQGILARTDKKRGPWKPAAGELDGQILGIIGTEYPLPEDSTDYDTLYDNRINGIRVVEGKGIYHDGNITLDPTGEFQEQGISRLFIMAASDIKSGSGWVKQETNDENTRARNARGIKAYLRGLWKKGALVGKTEDDAFFVICDDTNNTPVDQATRTMNTRIGLAAVHAAEFIEDTLELDTRAVDAALASSA